MVTVVILGVGTLTFQGSTTGDCDQIKTVADTDRVLTCARHCVKSF